MVLKLGPGGPLCMLLFIPTIVAKNFNKQDIFLNWVLYVQKGYLSHIMSDIAMHAINYNILKFILCYIANNCIKRVMYTLSNERLRLINMLLFRLLNIRLISLINTIQVWHYHFHCLDYFHYLPDGWI